MPWQPNSGRPCPLWLPVAHCPLCIGLYGGAFTFRVSSVQLAEDCTATGWLGSCLLTEPKGWCAKWLPPVVVCTTLQEWVAIASFPGSPSFRAIIPRMTFDPPEGKAEGEPGRFCHMTSVMLRHPYIRYRRGRTASMSLYLCIVGISLRSETKNLCVVRGSPCVRMRSNNG